MFRDLRIIYLIFFILSFQSLFAQKPSDQSYPQFLEEGKPYFFVKELEALLKTGKSSEYRKAIQEYLESRQVEHTKDSAKIIILYSIEEFYKKTEGNRSSEFLVWLSHSKRFRKFLYLQKESDDSAKVCDILEKIYLSDPEAATKYFNLALAMACTWDESRPYIHNEGGAKKLSFDADIENRFSYFSKVYESGRAQADYSTYGFNHLIYVVDTPVPVSELEWARDNYMGKIKNWQDAFQKNKDKVLKDMLKKNKDAKFSTSIKGEYSLSNIYKNIGKPIDQSYFYTITARALGVPATFHFAPANEDVKAATGSFGNMTSSTTWNVGNHDRLLEERTPLAIHPQTNEKISGREVKHMWMDKFQKDFNLESNYLLALAKYFKEEGKLKMAYYFANRCRKVQPLEMESWDLILDIFEETKDTRKIPSYVYKKIEEIQIYPHLLLEHGQKERERLMKYRYTMEADKIRGKIFRTIAKNKIFKERQLKEDIRALYAESLEIKDERLKKKSSGEARRAFEKFIKSKKGYYSGFKRDYGEYLDLTKEHNQSEVAMRFTKSYFTKMNLIFVSKKKKSSKEASLGSSADKNKVTVCRELFKKAFANCGIEDKAKRYFKQ